MSLEPPPTQQPIITDQSGFPALPWIVFFNALFDGDAGNAWSPVFQNLTISGGPPQIIGKVYQLSKYLSVFTITLVPPKGGSITGVAGTVLISNFPLQMANNGVCFAVSGELGTVSGMCDGGQNIIFPPSFTGVTVPLTIVGLVEAS